MKRGFLLFSIMLFYVTSLSVILAQGITPAYAIDDIAVSDIEMHVFDRFLGAAAQAVGHGHRSRGFFF